MRRQFSSSESGFTLIELMVVMAIILTLFGLSVVGLRQPQTSTNSSSAVETLVNDLKTQQMAAMSGATGSSSSQQMSGIYVQHDKYTLFTGSTYSASDDYNYVYNPPDGVTFSTTFPSNIVQFTKGDGAVNGFAAGSNTITVTTSAGNKVITITRYGAITTT
jgi:prepilin-type N-terminal cleavage/methylation domain-containing protein